MICYQPFLRCKSTRAHSVPLYADYHMCHSFGYPSGYFRMQSLFNEPSSRSTACINIARGPQPKVNARWRAMTVVFPTCSGAHATHRMESLRFSNYHLPVESGAMKPGNRLHCSLLVLTYPSHPMVINISRTCWQSNSGHVISRRSTVRRLILQSHAKKFVLQNRLRTRVLQWHISRSFWQYCLPLQPTREPIGFVALQFYYSFKVMVPPYLSS